jgi:hypothetical protein|nr:MAG TPA: hypothetical protein [Caudoviricetes sp.]
MTVREWCSHTANVFYGGDDVHDLRTGKRPVRAVAGCIPDELSRREVLWITVAKINPDNMGFLEVAVTLV